MLPRKMIMNFKFEDDVENNTMTVEVSISQRKKLNEERKKVYLENVLALVEENYTPPKTHTIGDLISNMHLRLDSDYPERCTGQWVFALLPKKASPKTKATKKKKQ